MHRPLCMYSGLVFEAHPNSSNVSKLLPFLIHSWFSEVYNPQLPLGVVLRSPYFHQIEYILGRCTLHVRVCVCVHIFMCACMYACMSVSMHVRENVYIHYTY